MELYSLPALIVLLGAVAAVSLLGVVVLIVRSLRRGREVATLRRACAALVTGEAVEMPDLASDDLRAIATSVAAIAVGRDEATQASRSGRQFLAAASHDLRQPLQAVGLFVATLSQYPLGVPERKVVDKIESALAALEHLLDTLLDISRLDAGAARAHQAIFSPQDLFERLALEFVPLAEHKGLRMRFAPTSALVRSDPELLERILRNLVTNAVRYTHKGQILVGARRRGPNLLVEVWDTGQGIPPDKLGEVFREFSQLQAGMRDRHHGLGLGLAIVDRLARLLSHRIEVSSTPEVGSVFRVVIPLVVPSMGRQADDGDGVEIKESESPENA